MLAPIKYACQAVTGKGRGLDEACKAISMRDVGEITLPFGDGHDTSGVFVIDLGQDQEAAEAERIEEFAFKEVQETQALRPPLKVDIQVPTNSKPGQEIKAQGPGGPIMVTLPENVVPGGTMRYEMNAKPRYLVEVPQGVGPGWSIKFQTATSEMACVVVPEGKSPGDDIKVTRPCLLVQVPEQTKAGNFVKFCHTFKSKKGGDARGSTVFFRARVPEGKLPKQYFVANLPGPQQSQVTNN